jgi:hypothetical protein
MTTKDLIEKFDKECPPLIGAGSKTLIRELIQSSLTELLDSIEKETLGKIPFTMKRSRKEVINIINSHR